MMARRSRRRQVEGSSSTRPNSPAKPTKFYEIILNPQAGRLKIPPEFVNIHGDSLPNLVFLKVPSGDVWEVELVFSNSEMWLEKGWAEFEEHYSIDLGFFLVFKYNGGSKFGVLIFDKSGIQVEYPLKEKTERFVNHGHVLDRGDDKSDDSVVLLEKITKSRNINGRKLKGSAQMENDVSIETLYSPTRQNKRRNRPNESLDDPLKCKKGEEMPNCSPHGTLTDELLSGNRNGAGTLDCTSEGALPKRMKRKDLNFNLDMQSVTQKIKKEHVEGIEKPFSERSQTVSSDSKKLSIAYQRANTFITENSSGNPMFALFMQPSYLSRSGCLCLPLIFLRKKFTKKRNNVILRIPGWKSWPTTCILYEIHAKIFNGWKEFIRDNGVKVGDVCVFELVKGTEPVLHVYIFGSEYAMV